MGVAALLKSAAARFEFRQCNLQHAHIGFGLENFQRFRRVSRRHEHFHKLLADLLRSRCVHCAVQGNDAAKRRGRICLKSFGVALERIGTHGHAARIGVLHDHAGGFCKAFHTFPSRIGIGNVVVRQLFALQLHSRDQGARCWVQVAVESCRLMRVLAVAQVLQFHKTTIGLRWIFCAGMVVQIVGRQVVADGRVVIADAVKGCDRQGKASFVRHFALRFELVNDSGVL